MASPGRRFRFQVRSIPWTPQKVGSLEILEKQRSSVPQRISKSYTAVPRLGDSSQLEGQTELHSDAADSQELYWTLCSEDLRPQGLWSCALPPLSTGLKRLGISRRLGLQRRSLSKESEVRLSATPFCLIAAATVQDFGSYFFCFRRVTCFACCLSNCM